MVATRAALRSAPTESENTVGSKGGRRKKKGCHHIQGLKLRRRWGIERHYTDRDSWQLAKSVTSVACEDVPHTGCCKAYAITILLLARGKRGSRLELEAGAARLRTIAVDCLTECEFALLSQSANTNHADWRRAVNLEDAKVRLSLNYQKALKFGHSMSPVWLEEWETSRIAAFHNVFILELHDACSSNQDRSHAQLIKPAPSRSPLSHDTLIVLRRIQCHYVPVWIKGKPSSRFRDLDPLFLSTLLPQHASSLVSISLRNSTHDERQKLLDDDDDGSKKQKTTSNRHHAGKEDAFLTTPNTTTSTPPPSILKMNLSSKEDAAPLKQ